MNFSLRKLKSLSQTLSQLFDWKIRDTIMFPYNISLLMENLFIPEETLL